MKTSAGPLIGSKCVEAELALDCIFGPCCGKSVINSPSAAEKVSVRTDFDAVLDMNSGSTFELFFRRIYNTAPIITQATTIMAMITPIMRPDDDAVEATCIVVM